MLLSESAGQCVKTANINRSASVRCLMLVYLASGTCSLIDEVVWVRLLKLIIGNTVYASSIVVSVFMGGLALGALVMGRYSDRVRKPLRLYALIELAITISALSLPWTLKLTDAFYVWFWRTAHPGQTWLIVIQTTLSALILLVPTLLMGSTLPLLGRFVTSVEEEAGSLVGRLYALNTLGAAIGCFGAGFVLLRLVGVMGTLWIAAALNLLVACGGYALHRLSGGPARQPSFRPDGTAALLPQDRGLVLLGLGFFLSGFVSIAYELLWMRSIVHTVGAFSYVFSAVLTLYLLGNVIGTVVGTCLVGRIKNHGATYAVLLFALGFCGVLYLPWLYLCSYHLFPSLLDSLEVSSWTHLVPWRMFSPLVKGVFLFLVPSTVMGIGMPIMLQAWVNRTRRVGWSTGAAYGTNTLGAVAGGLLTGFVLIPALGVQRTMVGLGLVTLWVAAVLWLFYLRATTLILARRLALPLAALLITVHVGSVPVSLYARIVALSQFVQRCTVVAYEEGINTIVSLHEDPDHKSLYLCTSGRMVAGTDQAYRADQKMLGHFPLLLNAHAQQALSVGFGSGESTACLSKHGIEQVDCVEIAPELVAFSQQHFDHINLGDRLGEHVRLIYMDARNYLHLTENRYDVIINDCTSMRGFAENGSLFTKEYFESARDCLNDNGCFMSWIDIYTTESPRVVDSVIGTMMEVFPYVTLWYIVPEPTPFFMIVGSEKPQTFSVAHVDRELAKKSVRESLAQIHCYGSHDIMSCYIADETDLKRYLRRYVTNSDFFPVVEFCPDGRFSGGVASSRNFFISVRSQSIYRHLDWTGVCRQDQARWLDAFEKTRQVAHCVLMAAHSNTDLEKLDHAMRGLATVPDYQPLIQIKDASERALFEVGIKYVAAGQCRQASYIAGELARRDPNSAIPWMLHSQASREAGDTDRALKAARRAVEVAPDDLSAQYNLWSILTALDDSATARATLNATAQRVSAR